MTNIFVTFYPNICPELVCVAAKTKKEYAEKMTKNGLRLLQTVSLLRKKIFKVYFLSS